jgi:hypothetical protein
LRCGGGGTVIAENILRELFCEEFTFGDRDCAGRGRIDGNIEACAAPTALGIFR